MLFADLLSLHLVTFLLFFILVCIYGSHTSDCVSECPGRSGDTKTAVLKNVKE